MRTSLSSVRFSSIFGTPGCNVVSSNRYNNAPSVDGPIREGKSGSTMLLSDCCGGGGFSARPCIFKDALCIGVPNARAPGGTAYVLEFPLVPFSSPSDAPNSFTVFPGRRAFLPIVAVWAHPETCVLAIVIPARLLSIFADVTPFLLELNVFDRTGVRRTAKMALSVLVLRMNDL